MAEDATTARTREDSVLLAAGSVGAGITAYAFVVLGNRAYGSDQFNSVAQVWTLWFMAAAVLTFPIQHWMVNTHTVDTNFRRIRATLPRLAAMVAALAVAVGLICSLFRTTLFASSSLAYPLSVAGVTAGAGLLGVLRGSLASRGRFGAVGLALVGENLVRLALGGLVVAFGGGVETFGLTVATGMIVAALWPSAWRFGSAEAKERAPLVHVMSGLGGGNLIAQTVLTGGPLLLAILGGAPAEVTSLFVALSLMRSPYLVAVGVSVRATAALSHEVLISPATIGRRWRQLLVATVGMALVAALGAAAFGPVIVRWIFGADVVLSRGAAVMLALATVLAIGNLGASLLALVERRSREVLIAWLVAVVVGAGALPFRAEPTARVVAALVLAEATALAVMAWRGLARPSTRSGADVAARPRPDLLRGEH